MANAKKLGKGLSALLGDAAQIDNDESVKELKITDIEPNKNQPRKSFDTEKLEALASSISEHGIIQPLVVKKGENGYYTIIAGERRWRAARMAGLKTVPVFIKDYENEKIMEVALVENLQREDLNPIEEAEGYSVLIKKFKLTQEEVASRVSKSRPAIANTLRLLNLSEKVRKMVINGKLSGGQARALVVIENKEIQETIAEKIVKEGLNVRQVEQLCKNLQNEKKQVKTKKEDINILNAIKTAENNLSGKLGTKVRIVNGKSKGKIEIEYYNMTELESLIEKFEKI